MITGQILLKNKRSKNELWKKEDIERFFDLTDDTPVSEDIINKNFNVKFDKYDQFVIAPKSKFGSDMKDEGLKNHNDLIYFVVYGCDKTDERFVKHVFVGYAIGKPQLLRSIK